MKYNISSTIEYEYREGASMDEKDPLIEQDSSGLLEEKSSTRNDGTFRHKSEAKSEQNSFFHRVRVEKNGVSQITNVNVNIQPDAKENDPCTGCFKMILSCFK